MNSAIKIFTDYRQFQIFILGIFSGIPLTIIYSTLATWMKQMGIDIAVITTFAIARVFYSLKFLWAPFIDRIDLPILSKIGHRKSWMCLISGIIAFIAFGYSKFNPIESLTEVYILTIALGLASATLDIVIDAYRIDTIDKDKQSIAAANTTFGYLLGGRLIAGVAAFYIASIYGWEYSFIMIGVLYAIGIFFILSLKEPKIEREEFKPLSLRSWKIMTINPFIDFLQRDGAIIILLAVIFYKLGDAFLGVVAYPFYLDLGFTLTEINWIVKVFGLSALVLGSYIGGFIMYRFGNFKGLMVGGIAQSVTNLSFVWLNHMGHDISALAIAIAVENIASGMGNAALIGYLSYLCNKQFSATQYALLSSASGLFSHSIVMYGGTMVNKMGYDMYFMLTVVMAIPGLLLLFYLNKKYGLSNYANA
ncbi:MAG: MFS transporter [Rickettsiaceae bacterium]|nr:MFS transporter [Rickettsiaceae bacterium]